MIVEIEILLMIWIHEKKGKVDSASSQVISDRARDVFET
jgi:hypothetical protein